MLRDSLPLFIQDCLSSFCSWEEVQGAACSACCIREAEDAASVADDSNGSGGRGPLLASSSEDHPAAIAVEVGNPRSWAGSGPKEQTAARALLAEMSRAMAASSEGGCAAPAPMPDLDVDGIVAAAFQQGGTKCDPQSSSGERMGSTHGVGGVGGERIGSEHGVGGVRFSFPASSRHQALDLAADPHSRG